MRNCISLVLVLLLVFAGTQDFAQTRNQVIIDSLKTELSHSEEDTNRVKLLILLSAHDGYKTSKYDSGLYYGHSAVKLAQKLNYKHGEADAHSLVGINYYYLGDYPESMKSYLAAIRISEAIGNKSGEAVNHTNIGIVFVAQGNNDSAISHYNKAAKLFEEAAYKEGELNNLYNIGNVYVRQKNYPEALEYYKKGLKISEEIGDKPGISNYYANTGVLFEELGEYDEALKNHFASLEITEKLEDKFAIAIDFLNIGAVYTKMQNPSEGKVWLFKAVELGKEIEAKDILKDVYAELAVNDSALGNFKGAFEHYKLFAAYKDSIINEENTRKQTQIEMHHAFEKKEAAADAERLKKDARHRNVRNISFGAVGALAMFSFFVMRQRNKFNNERKRSEKLLLNILPAEVAKELKTTGSAAAKQFDEVSVLFTDFVHFTQTAENLTPQQLVHELNECFTAFDEIIERNGLEKIKTIGDAYMAVCGLPAANPQHAQSAVRAALEIREFIEKRRAEENAFQIRIGVHSGSVVAGIVGVKKFAYDIWGDTVNTAARMESSGEAGKVNISEATYHLVKNDFACTHRGRVDAKGKGEMDMYFVDGSAQNA